MKRIASVVAVVAVLTATSTVGPALAAADTVVTVKGHVYDEEGDPLPGIRVRGGCQCDFEQGAPPFSGTTVTTSSTGYFSFRLREKYASYLDIDDPEKRYLSATANLVEKRSAYFANTRLRLASEVAGTVRDETGARARRARVQFYDATTGKRVREQGRSVTDENGRFHALVPGGTYKIRLSGVNDAYDAEWYGDATTRAASPVVTVESGGKTAGVNAALTRLMRVAGRISLGDSGPILEQGDRIAVTATDASGAVVHRGFAGRYFFIERLLPGTYDVTFSPSGSNFFVPQTVRYTILPGVSIDGARVTLEPIPASATDRRHVVISGAPQTLTAQKGERYRVRFRAYSYGDVTGGTITFYAGGKKLDTLRVPASGSVVLTTRFSKVKAGSRYIWAEFSGTSTTLPAKHTTFRVKITD